jgi:hypothetical protein
MKLSNMVIIEMMIDEMKDIKEISYPLCKYSDNEVNVAAAKINKKAHQCHQILEERKKQILNPNVD